MSFGVRRNIAEKIAELITATATTSATTITKFDSSKYVYLVNNLQKCFELKIPTMKNIINDNNNNNDIIELHFPVIKTRYNSSSNIASYSYENYHYDKILIKKILNEKFYKNYNDDNDKLIKDVVFIMLNNDKNDKNIKNIKNNNDIDVDDDNNENIINTIIFKLDRNEFFNETLNEYYKKSMNDINSSNSNCNDNKNSFIYGNNKNTNTNVYNEINEKYQSSTLDFDIIKKNNYIVEFSSPNIAKPFHVGHLRSTIIGNYISNLKLYLNNNVIKLNYLGDWGTQFGLLQIGIELLNLTDEQIKLNPIKNLYNAYVHANNTAKSNSKIYDKARILFTKLEENNDDNNTNDVGVDNNMEKLNWKKYRQYTIDELKYIYSRLNIEFDEYTWESDYNQNKIKNVLNLLEIKNLLLKENDGRRIIEIGNNNYDNDNNNQRYRRIPIIKSDGSTLYLARDIAALLDRFEKYKFDKIFYVVDNAQTDHFMALFEIIEKTEQKLINRMKHIKFGRIKGMSTRTGNVIFLNDVLDEAKNIMLQKQIQSPTTKIPIKNLDDKVADILGVSAVIVNDLKQRRQRDYDFNWDKVLQVNGDTGIKLQYTHCRLCSLMDNVATNIVPATEANVDLLMEPEAIQLIMEITKFPEILYKSDESLESCILVNYLFSLSKSISKALKRLNVKNEPNLEIQQQRILLFQISKNILYDGMKILGLKPLQKM